MASPVSKARRRVDALEGRIPIGILPAFAVRSVARRLCNCADAREKRDARPVRTISSCNSASMAEISSLSTAMGPSPRFGAAPSESAEREGHRVHFGSRTGFPDREKGDNHDVQGQEVSAVACRTYRCGPRLARIGAVRPPDGERPAQGAPQDQAGKVEVAGKQLTVREFVESGRRCDTPIPTDNQMRRARLAAEAVRRVAGVEDSLNPSNKVTIRVAFHVIHKGNEGKVSRARIDQQINVLNKNSGPSDSISRWPATPTTPTSTPTPTARTNTMGRHPSAEEREAKTTLGKDPERFLNLYTANLGDGLLGWATFPSDLAADVDMDGLSILHTACRPRTPPPIPPAVRSASARRPRTRWATGRPVPHVPGRLRASGRRREGHPPAPGELRLPLAGAGPPSPATWTRAIRRSRWLDPVHN